MKAILISILAFLAVGALGGNLYDDKEDAKQEVIAKYDAALNSVTRVLNEIRDEKQKTEESVAKDAKTEGKKKLDDATLKFRKEVVDATRSAIARGKPIATIECIAKVSIDGEKLLEAVHKDYEASVDAVKPNKDKRLVLAEIQVDLIKKAIEGLKEESLRNLATATPANLKTIKADALKKAATAEKQLHDIEGRITTPTLKDEYRNLRTKNSEKYKEVSDGLSKRLKTCLG